VAALGVSCISTAMKPTKAAIEEAERKPNGVVYAIDGDFGDGSVPPESILGAWKTDAEGNIVGEFIPSPNFKPKSTEDGGSLRR
jgi:hypothetical protein